ncbi:CYTH domain-containing protein [Thalassotalea eurytherma]|uniref:Inorganic triphosphatase n=1 Tax=Thalassotalea eurytherma TaxID=1144278 RepID=A0ABQ6H4T6_9GAMM|nr:CYTH and CHAD domain-containing protein [Thalassotalea eurytherma]GLX82519.1 inorganic triphosphatase [Thalassotalea eurytherma]
MADEIELKFLVEDTDVISKIEQYLANSNLSYQHKVNTLKNQYFDTPTLDFRALDFGLRTRNYQSQESSSSEQTIKTAGQVVGGLHKRPEYNVSLTGNFPQLSKFPVEIWPEGCDVNQLQESLICLFSTDFERHTWLVDLDNGAQFEFVYDQGAIRSADREELINEVELELVKGNTQDLFDFARQLFHFLNLRSGIESKAARGYGLYHQKPSSYPTQLPMIAIEGQASLSSMFYQGMSQGLTHLQKTIAGYIKSPDFDTLGSFVDSLILIRHGFWLFQDAVEDETKSAQLRTDLSHFIKLFSWVDNAQFFTVLMNKSGAYRKKIEYSEQLVEQLKIEHRRFPEQEQVKQLIMSERFNLLQLDLLEMLVNQSITIKPFAIDNRKLASQKLEESLQQAQLHSDGNDYLEVAQALLAQRKLLIRSLLTGNWLGNYFEPTTRKNYRNAWLDVLEGLNELQTLWILDVQLDGLTPKNEKLCTWFDMKMEHLVETISQSHQHAASIIPYWRN